MRSALSSFFSTVIVAFLLTTFSSQLCAQTATLTSISPTAIAPGMQMTLTGSGFGASPGRAALGGGANGIVVSWSDTQIVVTVPANVSPGNAAVVANGVMSNGIAFTVIPSTLTSISPTAVAPGMQMTLTGHGFGAAPGRAALGGGANGIVVSWNDTQIVVTVPANVSPGNAAVVANGVMSNGIAFTVVPPPSIVSLSPTSGTAGTPVTITGSNLGTTGAVTFNGTVATPTNSNGTSIVVPVPAGATTGSVVVTVGGLASNGVSFTVLSNFTTTSGHMGTSRYAQAATRLATGQTLITGGMSNGGVANSAEIYTAGGQAFASTAPMIVARWLHTATLLTDGTVLIAGGSDLADQETLDSAEIYNPATGTFTLLSSTLNTARVGHTATLLNNGQVLIVGGYDPQYGLIADAELYDPPTQTFIDLGDTNSPRYGHTVTILQSGQALIAGGEADPTPSAALTSAELFNVATQTFTPIPVPMTSAREGHAAVLLNNGQVLITGGDAPGNGSLNTAEIYDRTSNTFAAISSTMTTPRILHSANLLNGGRVLITGGATDSSSGTSPVNTAELYDPGSQTFTPTAGTMTSIREYGTAVLLNDGTVLIAGGTDGTNIFNSAELYMPNQLNGLASIAVSPVSPSIGAGAEQRFTAIATFTDSSTQTLASALWSSSNPTVATISNDATNSGAAASLTRGLATITASAAGISGSASLTVLAPTLVSIQLTPQNPAIPQGATQQFTATGVYTDGSAQDLTTSATWSSSASVVAVITGNGLAAGLFQGNATVQASFGSVSTTTSLSVGPPALVGVTVIPATATIATGVSQQYQAIGTYSDGSTQNVTTLLSWSSSTPSVGTVSLAGLAVGTSQGSTTISASFEAISVSVPLTVGPPSLASLIVTPNAGSLPAGTTQQLTATGTYTDGSTQNLTASSSWSSSNPAILSVTTTGMATAATSVGEVTITATIGSIRGTSVLLVTSGATQANLNTSRYLHSATPLETGKTLVAGGINCPSAGSCTYLNSAEIYDPTSGAFTNTGLLAQARSAPAVLLDNGNVFIAGGYFCDNSGNCSSLISAELYSAATNQFSSVGNMTVARSSQTMTLLSNGTVLIAGGQNCIAATSCTALSSAEIYDPVAGTFTAASNSMSAARYGASAIALNSGLVLIAGGFDGTNLPAAVEIYNPATPGFTGAGPNLNTPRFNATATLLNNGQVLVAGGSTCSLPGCPTSAAEIYDPVANTFTPVPGSMMVPRFNHTATLLTSGQVAVAGGFSSCASSPCTSEASTEVFDPVAGAFSSSHTLANARAGQTATLGANGDALLIGGINAGVTLASDAWYQPTSLTPPGLLFISVTPVSGFLMPGQTQPFVATGTFNNGSTETLQSVIWTSSNPSAAVISNSPGNVGVANAQAMGTTTITATAGDMGGSASLSVASLVSLAITPANPTITVGAGQQLTAVGTFSDGSTHSVTTSAAWSSSNNPVALIGTTSGTQGFLMGASAGTATIIATLGSISATTPITVQNSPTVSAPTIISVSPTSGVGGTQVTVSGSGFGATQGSGTIWLGSTYANVATWSDRQIVATVAPIAQSGTAQVQQNGLSSNAVSFSVNTANISAVSPTSGVPGTPVTITGSGFGSAQGSGQVWLGTANGVVQSWSDTQIVAEVATGSQSGSALVLQNGVMSNAVPFAVNSLQITTVTPNSGGPGTTVTITGNGFGATQGNGVVWLGSTSGNVMSWSNTQVIATVASNAVTGVARIQQGVWSNGITFTVPTSGGTLTLNPNMLNMVVGETHNLQALDATGQSVTGLTWTSSNAKIVSLSTDDPPILTAHAIGHTTVTAGSASADIIVSYSGTLPTGTVIWSNPGDGSGVNYIVPAVPSATGVADIFAFNADGTVSAIKSDGTTAWTANLNGAGYWETTPDFQGGLVVAKRTAPQSIVKLDGITGQANPAYTAPTQNDSLGVPNVHTDGTTFTVATNEQYSYAEGALVGTISVIGIDPTTGNQKFIVPLDQSTSSSTTSRTVNAVDGVCDWGPGSYSGTTASTTSSPPIVVGTPIIAGDGYFYIPYEYQNKTSVSQSTLVCWTSSDNTSTTSTVVHLAVMRVGSDGSSTKIDLKDWKSRSMGEYANVIGTYTLVNSLVTTGAVPVLSVQMITNADKGIAFGWEADTPAYCATGPWGYAGCYSTVAAASSFGFASTVYTSLAFSANLAAGVVPVLQAQDGTFYGNDNTYSKMIHFDQYGNTIWSVPNDWPQIATADGGVIGYSGITYDSHGRATGQLGALPTQSWTGNAYSDGPVTRLVFMPPVAAETFETYGGGNPSGQGTSVQPIGRRVSDEIAAVARGYVGSQNWLDKNHHNQCNLFVHDVLTQSGGAFAAPMQESWKERLKYYIGLVSSPIYPALAGDWANPNKVLSCWQTVPGGSDNALPGDVIAEAITYSDATGHVGIVTGTQQTTSADSAAPCFPPYSPAGLIDFSNYGFRPDNWVDPFKDPFGQPCRISGKKSNAVVKRFVCQ